MSETVKQKMERARRRREAQTTAMLRFALAMAALSLMWLEGSYDSQPGPLFAAACGCLIAIVIVGRRRED